MTAGGLTPKMSQLSLTASTADSGSATAMVARDAKTGGAIYERRRLEDAYPFTASPWAARGCVFCLDESGVCHVPRAGQRFELLHTNELAEDDMCMATAAIVGDQLLIRTSARIYCIQSN